MTLALEFFLECRFPPPCVLSELNCIQGPCGYHLSFLPAINPIPFQLPKDFWGMRGNIAYDLGKPKFLGASLLKLSEKKKKIYDGKTGQHREKKAE